MNVLQEQIQQKDACAFTHSGKFHADDVFSSALLFYLNPEITITRGNRVPEEFEGVVFDIGRGAYDHHQRDSRIRENGVPYAAFGLLWEVLGTSILGEELAVRFDEEFIQPLDLNDNTGEKNELAALIGNFNLSWDEEGNNDGAFFQAVSVAGMILDNKFAKYKGNERADKQVEDYLNQHSKAISDGVKSKDEAKILVMPQFVPCQKKLSETAIEFVIFPSNRGGYCIQPQKKEYSMNYKCSFKEQWLGLENEELQQATGLKSASFCHKGGFLMTVGELSDAIAACEMSQESYVNEPTIAVLEALSNATEEHKQLEELIHGMSGLQKAQICYTRVETLPEISMNGSLAEVDLDKQEWKKEIKDIVKQLLATKPEAVVISGQLLYTYAVVHALRKKHIPVLSMLEQGQGAMLVRIPSGS